MATISCDDENPLKFRAADNGAGGVELQVLDGSTWTTVSDGDTVENDVKPTTIGRDDFEIRFDDSLVGTTTHTFAVWAVNATGGSTTWLRGTSESFSWRQVPYFSDEQDTLDVKTNGGAGLDFQIIVTRKRKIV